MNQAHQWLKQGNSPAEVITRLVEATGLSPRQAYRYVQGARSLSGPQAIPEAKSVFTVKLPLSLMRRVRRTAREEDRSISDWVAEALEQRLERSPAHG